MFCSDDTAARKTDTHWTQTELSRFKEEAFAEIQSAVDSYNLGWRTAARLLYQRLSEPVLAGSLECSSNAVVRELWLDSLRVHATDLCDEMLHLQPRDKQSRLSWRSLVDNQKRKYLCFTARLGMK